MDPVYSTSDGDVLDEIVHIEYKTSPQAPGHSPKYKIQSSCD